MPKVFHKVFTSRALIFQPPSSMYLGRPSPEIALEKREKRSFNLREMLPLIRRCRRAGNVRGYIILRAASRLLLQ